MPGHNSRKHSYGIHSEKFPSILILKWLNQIYWNVSDNWIVEPVDCVSSKNPHSFCRRYGFIGWASIQFYPSVPAESSNKDWYQSLRDWFNWHNWIVLLTPLCSKWSMMIAIPWRTKYCMDLFHNMSIICVHGKTFASWHLRCNYEVIINEELGKSELLSYTEKSRNFIKFSANRNLKHDESSNSFVKISWRTNPISSITICRLHE